MNCSAKCNSGGIAIQWFHIKHYLDYQYTKTQPYTSRVQTNCDFARYATLVPRLSISVGNFMRTKHPFVLNHIRNKGEVGTMELV